MISCFVLNEGDCVVPALKARGRTRRAPGIEPEHAVRFNPQRCPHVQSLRISISMQKYLYIDIYTYICTNKHMYVYIYMYICI